ncbi:MAG: TrmH family RNA methyltransferase [Deinococcales bacterium]
MDRLLKTTKHQGIVAELPELDFGDEEAPFRLAKKRNEHPLLVLLDQIHDPHNYGAIIRSAEALGAHGVVTEERRSAPLSAAVVKSSAGATNHLP